MKSADDIKIDLSAMHLDGVDDRDCPLLEDFFEPVDYWPTKWGDDVAVKSAWIGIEKRRYLVQMRQPPDEGHLIINHGLPPELQVWHRENLPYEWTPESIIEEADLKYNKDRSWWANKATVMMREFRDRHTHNRALGVHIWINGKIIWMPGPYWFFLQWCVIDTGYPDFFEAQLHVAYVMDYVCEDPNNFGLLYLKRRREGGSYLFIAFCMEYIMRTRKAIFGFQGNVEDEANEDFQEKIVPMWRNMPLFFKPKNSGSDDPKNELAFKKQASGGKKKDEQLGLDSGLESYVRIAYSKANGKAKFDRLKLHRFLRDEWAKSNEDIYKTFRTLKETMSGPDNVIGRAFYPSTVEDMSNENALMAKEMWDDSDPSERDTSLDGFTVSGLLGFFKPAWHGLYIKGVSFIGPHGESIIGKPNDFQFDWLVKKYPRNRKIYEMGGAWHFLMYLRSRETGRGLISLKRQYPFTPQDAFNLDADKALINPEKVSEARNKLASRVDGVEYWKKLLVRGKLDWKETFTNEEGQLKGVIKSDVIFTPDPKGSWLLKSSLVYSANWKANCVMKGSPRHNVQMRERYGDIKPRPDGGHFSIGVDPIDKGKAELSGTTSKKKLSKFSITVFRKWNPSVEKQGAIRESFCFSAQFKERWDYRDDLFEELAKSIVFFGSAAHIESNRGDVCIGWLKRMGFYEMILTRPLVTFSPEAVRSNTRIKVIPHAGTPASDDLYKIGEGIVNNYVTKFSSPETDPFPDFWEDCATLDPTDMQPFDAYVSGMFALLDGYGAGGIIAEPEKNRDIGGGYDKVEQFEPWWPTGHDVDTYRI